MRQYIYIMGSSTGLCAKDVRECPTGVSYVPMIFTNLPYNVPSRIFIPWHQVARIEVWGDD